MARKRRVKLMWDYDAFPLWTLWDETGDEEPWSEDELELPISETLRRDLQAWSDEWTAAMFADGGPTAPGWQPPPDERLTAWDSRGRSLLDRVREELGPDFEVGYFNERDGEVEWA